MMLGFSLWRAACLGQGENTAIGASSTNAVPVTVPSVPLVVDVPQAPPPGLTHQPALTNEFIGPQLPVVEVTPANVAPVTNMVPAIPITSTNEASVFTPAGPIIGSTTNIAAAPLASTLTNLPVEATAPGTTNVVVEVEAPIPANEPIDFTFGDGVPLNDVIKSLAAQAEINIIFDPKLSTNAVDATGKPFEPVMNAWSVKNVTAKQALEALLENYGYALLSNPKTKISQVSFKPQKDQEPAITKVVQLKYCNTTNIVVLIKSMLTSKNSQVLPDVRTSQLVIFATEREHMAVEELLNKLDTPVRQVLIEARLLETSQNPQSIRGIDWSGTMEAQRVSFGNGYTAGSSVMNAPGAVVQTVLPSGRTVSSSQPSSIVSTLTTSLGGSGSSSGSSSGGSSVSAPSAGPSGFSMNTLNGVSPNLGIMNADGVSAVLSFLNKDSDTEVVSLPRTVTLDNETATLAVTRAYPIFQSTAGSANSPASSQTLYTNLGTILVVTPRISGATNVELTVKPEVSNIDAKDTQTINGLVNVANIYAIRKIETHVIIPSGHTLVMGGLISDSVTKANTKVPILGDLPIVGLAFRQDSKKRIKQNLLIFVTPTIIGSGDFTATPTDFLHARTNELNRIKASEAATEEGPWDSGKPKDWNYTPVKPAKPAKPEN